MTDPLQRRLLRVSVTSLGTAFVVLIAGLTILERRLQGMLFVLYWLGCFALVGASILAAALDLWLLRRQARADRRELARRVFSKPAPAQSGGSNGSDANNHGSPDREGKIEG